MIFYNNKRILFLNSHKRNNQQKKFQKNHPWKNKVKNKSTILIRNKNNKSSKKHLKRQILVMNLIRLKGFQKNHNKYLMFATLKVKMEVV